jgi:hypothetical protein
MQTYTIWAYSPSLNESHRQFDLANINTALLDPIKAQQLADAHAHQYNQQRKQHKTDWVGQIKLETVGVTTIPGYIQK